jgi:hypothetical protein
LPISLESAKILANRITWLIELIDRRALILKKFIDIFSFGPPAALHGTGN